MKHPFAARTLVLAMVLGGLAACSQPAADASTPAAAPASALTVQATMPQTQDWPQTVPASGPFAAWQEVIVTPETGGLQLVELTVDVGAQVKRGQLLARLSDASLQVSRRKQEAAVAQAQAGLDQALTDLTRARQVEGIGALSEQKIESYRITAESAQASLKSAQADLQSIKLQLTQTRVLAADDGTVSSKSAVLGNVVNAGTELYRLVRQSRVEWRPELDAQQLAMLRTGSPAQVKLPGGEGRQGQERHGQELQGQELQGRVRMVAPTLSTSTGRATVYVSLPAGSAARPGMFGSGGIELGSKPALTLPATAVVMRDGRAYVYLLGEGDTVSAQAVVTGRRRGDRVEIVSGLNADTRVVAAGGAFLSEGARVTVVAAGQAASAGSAASAAHAAKRSRP